MRQTLQTFVYLFLLAFCASSVHAQTTITQLADASDLDPGNGSDFQCVQRLSSGVLIGFNEEAEALVSFNPSTSTLTPFRSQTDLQNDLATTGIDACDASASEGGTLFFSLRDGGNDSYIYKIESDGSGIVSQNVNGANSLEATSSALYIGIVGAFGDESNGLYELALPLTGSGSLDPVLTGQDVSTISFDGALASDSDGNLLLLTNESDIADNFGDATEVNKVFEITGLGGTATITELADPIANGPLSDGGLLHIEVVNFGGADRIVVSNNSFGATNGEEFAVIQTDGAASVLATSADIESATSISDFAPTEDGGFAVAPNGDIFAASVDGGSFGESALVQISDAPLPVELTAFDVTSSGTAATLVWNTASETNNAGFEIQHRAPGATAFARAGFVDGNGTTTQPQSYRFRVDALTPGQHTFRLKQVDTDGTTSLSPERTITVRTGETLTLAGPNPLPSGTPARLTVQVDAAQSVDVALYNVLGQRVQTVFSGSATPTTPAEATLTTDRLPSGVYFLRATGASIQATEQITVVR